MSWQTIGDALRPAASPLWWRSYLEMHSDADHWLKLAHDFKDPYKAARADAFEFAENYRRLAQSHSEAFWMAYYELLDRCPAATVRLPHSETPDSSIDPDVAAAAVREALGIIGATVDNPLWSGRMSFDEAMRVVALDGESYQIYHPSAFHVFKLIADANGHIVSSLEIQRQVPATSGRIGQFLKRHLPAPLYAMVQSRAGHSGGFALCLPKLSRKKHEVSRKRHRNSKA
jgi:hypothetical protein